MFVLNDAGIAKLPDNIGACKNLSNLEASVNPLGKYVCFTSCTLSQTEGIIPFCNVKW